MTFARRRWTALHTILAIVATVLVWGILPIGIKSCAKETLLETQAPLWLALQDINELQDTAALNLKSKKELIQTIQELAQTQAGLELRLKTLETTEAQRARLEQLLKMPQTPGYETKVAHIVKRDLNGWWQQLWIDRGRVDGLRVGLGVISRDGVVGRVREVYDRLSVVELVTSPRYRMAAQMIGDERPFVFVGMGLRMGMAPYGKVQALQPDMALKKGETKQIVTTGLSGSFPAGLPIGELLEISGTGEGGLLEGRTRLSKSLQELKEVTVLVPYR